jgi:predicted kinase
VSTYLTVSQSSPIDGRPLLVITRGLPASGKTTLANDWVDEDSAKRSRVNRDDLRASLFNAEGVLDYASEQTVSTVQQTSVRAMLQAGRSVIVDDTNLRLKFARAWADMAVEEGVGFEVWDVMTPVDECVSRAADRCVAGGRFVSADVIRDIGKRFGGKRHQVLPTERKASSPPAPYVPLPEKPETWLVDVDGTLALMGDRHPHDLTRVSEDKPNWPVASVAYALYVSGVDLVIMSGRSESARADTEEWLNRTLGKAVWSRLIMRAEGDMRSDYIVKAELFDQHVRNEYNVVGCLDDRNQVVDMWRSMGLTCLQVAPGDF